MKEENIIPGGPSVNWLHSQGSKKFEDVKGNCILDGRISEWVRESMHLCVCERDRERERECVCVCVWILNRIEDECIIN